MRPRRTPTRPTTARATACGSRAATSRSRWPCSTCSASPPRTLPLLWRSRERMADAARGYRDGLRGPCGAAQAAAREDLVADDAGRAAPGHLAASLLARVDGPCPRPDARRRSRERVHLRAPRLRAPQDRPAAAAGRTCASCGAGASSPFEMARTNLRAQHFNTAFGQLWLVLNPLLLACVYFLLVDILRRGSRAAELLRAPAGGAVRLLLRLGRRSARRSSRSRAAGG